MAIIFDSVDYCFNFNTHTTYICITITKGEIPKGIKITVKMIVRWFACEKQQKTEQN